MRICIPVQAETVEAAKAMMKRAFAESELVELRIDALKNPGMEGLIGPGKGKLVVTNRRREEGGAFAGTESARVKLLEEAVQLGADYVDIEASTETVLMTRLRRQIERAGSRTKLIISWHDFAGTPSEARLRAKFREMAGLGPGIIKMVTFARSTSDNLRILNLIPYAKRRGRELIAFAMGEMGRPSRIASSLLGGYMTYAALAGGAESAPGQLTAADMKRIWEIALP